MPEMHANEIDIDAELVQRLLSVQFPGWSSLPIHPVTSAGTDNAVFRLGTEMLVRLPRLPSAAITLEKESKWLNWFASQVPLAIPTVLGQGEPSADFPWLWFIYRWLNGQELSRSSFSSSMETATALGEFVRCLHTLNTVNAPQPGDHNGWRGAPLHQRDAATRECITSLGNRIDEEAALRVWDTALDTEPWSREPVWLHGDLHSGNLLTKHGQLTAVIDYGCLGCGDPCCDLLPAWELFDRQTRQRYRNETGMDDSTWIRGKGWAVSWAVIVLPYYWDTNPTLVSRAKNVLQQALID